MVGNIDRAAFQFPNLNAVDERFADLSNRNIKTRATNSKAGCHDTIRRSGRSAGDYFLLTAPFIEPPRLRELKLLREIFIDRAATPP